MSTNKKRKARLASIENNNGNTPSKRIKLTNYSHPERTPVLHTTKDSITKSLDIIDFATVIPDSITAVHAPDELKAKGARRRWRDETRARALELQAKAASVMEARGWPPEENVQVHVDTKAPTSGPKIRRVAGSVGDPGAKSGLKSEGLDVKMVASTRLVTPVVKTWHASSEEYESACKEAKGAAKGRSKASAKGEFLRVITCAAPTINRPRAPKAATAIDSTAKERRLSSTGRILPVNKPPGLQRFEDTPLPPKDPPRLDDSDDSSESESDSSEDEDDVATRPSVRGSVSESFADRILEYPTNSAGGELGGPPAGREPAESKQNAILMETTELEERHDACGETVHIHNDDVIDSKGSQDEEYDPDAPLARIATRADFSKQLSKHRKSDAPVSRSSEMPAGTDHERKPPAAQRANVVVKKSAADGKLGGTRFGSGLSSSRSGTLTEVSSNRMTTTQSSIDPAAEDSEDLLEAIEDVTEEVLGDSVLSMDQCKLPHSRDSACEVDLDTLMTTDHSARKVPNSQDVVVMIAPDDGSSFDDWALEGTDLSRAMHGCSAGHGPELDTESTVVQPNDRTSAAAPASSPKSASSSSELPELSRTSNSAPRDEGAQRDQALKASLADDSALPASYEATKVVAPLRRKMTGMSSKHFSPAKRPRVREVAETKNQTPGRAQGAVQPVETDSPLTALQTALDRIVDCAPDAVHDANGNFAYQNVDKEIPGDGPIFSTRSSVKEEKTKASARKRKTAVDSGDDAVVDADYQDSQDVLQDNATQTPARQTRSNARTPGAKRKSTGKISEHFITDRVDLYNTTAGGGRILAGTSRAPVPSINAAMFGLIQEKIWREPFWLIIAVTFLNKTAGRSAVPVFWKLKEKYPTCEVLANADRAELLEMVRHLGLQNQRSKRLIHIAKAWTAEPPVAGKRYRTLNYPNHGDGRASTTVNVVDEDAEDCAGLLEIGNIPGCGQYAYDSWRIFCRDPLRGVADDYNGTNAKAEGFVPEWQRVLPYDKELRACLRWMWLREGWIWDPLTGEKRRATDEEMARAVQGEMEIEDPQERKFAAQAAGVDVTAKKARRGGNDKSLGETSAQTSTKHPADNCTAETGQKSETAVESSKNAPSDVPRTEASAATRALIAQESAAAPRTNSRRRRRPQRVSTDKHMDEPKPRRSSRQRAEKSKSFQPEKTPPRPPTRAPRLLL